MTVTTRKLTRAAGLCAVVAGLLFIGIQINHPHLDATFATTTEFTVRQALKVLMATLSLIAITGMYLRQVKQTGLLGLIGYLVFGAGYLMIMSIEVVGGSVLPSLCANVLARSAAALLAVGTIASIAIPVLPSSTKGCSPSPPGLPWSASATRCGASSAPGRLDPCPAASTLSSTQPASRDHPGTLTTARSTLSIGRVPVWPQVALLLDFLNSGLR